MAILEIVNESSFSGTPDIPGVIVTITPEIPVTICNPPTAAFSLEAGSIEIDSISPTLCPAVVRLPAAA